MTTMQSSVDNEINNFLRLENNTTVNTDNAMISMFN